MESSHALLDRMARIDVTSNDGQTAMDLAIMSCRGEVVQLLQEHAEKRVPLQLHAERGVQGRLIVTCRNLAGNMLCQFTDVNPEECLSTLVSAIEEQLQVPPPAGAAEW